MKFSYLRNQKGNMLECFMKKYGYMSKCMPPFYKDIHEDLEATSNVVHFPFKFDANIDFIW